MSDKLPEVYCANDCDWVGMEEDLEADADGDSPHCPKCDCNSAVLDIPEDWEEYRECRMAVERYNARRSAPDPDASGKVPGKEGGAE